MSESVPPRTDPGDQSALAPKPTREQIEAAIQNGNGIMAVALQGERLGIKPVPLRDQDGKRMFYSVAEAVDSGALDGFNGGLGEQLASLQTGGPRSAHDHIGTAEKRMGYEPGTHDRARAALDHPVGSEGRRQAHAFANEILTKAQMLRDTADVAEVGHFGTNAGHLAARTEEGDYIIGPDKPEARAALGEAGYTPMDPRDGDMAFPLNNDAGHNQAVRDELGIGPEHVYRAT